MLTPREFCEKIGLKPEITGFVLSYKMNEADYLLHKKLLRNCREDFIDAAASRADGPGWFPVFCIHAAIELKPDYDELGISETIYYDTFLDIRFWQGHYFLKTGQPGMDEYSWLTKHLLLQIFRLGRLQFEPLAFNRELTTGERKLKPGDLVLNVHIPEGGALDKDECDKSYGEASRFFRGIPPVFTCNSWLLSPALTRLLEPGSNIINFQNQYHVYDIDWESRQGERRIFEEVKDDPDLYPETTSLQRKAKKYLQDGNKIGLGRGIILWV